MKTHILALAITVAVMGCVRRESDYDAMRKDEFEGRLIELSGQATPASRVNLQVFQYSSGPRPKRYSISSDCFDAGYFDDRRNQYVSGFAPELPRSEPLHLPHDRFCDPDDLSRQRELREWMFSGASITVRPSDGRAVITTPAGATAVFVHKRSPAID